MVHSETVYTWAELFVRHLEAADERDVEAEEAKEERWLPAHCYFLVARC